MAKPIKITPVLKGNDAVAFLKKLKLNKRRTPDKAKLIAIRRDACALKAIFKS